MMSLRTALATCHAAVVTACTSVGRAVIVLLAIALSTITEKNPQKLLAARVPIVLSATRVIVVGAALGMMYQMRHGGIAGWPEVTLSIAIILALPLIAALEALTPQDTLAIAKQLFEQLGKGASRTVGNLNDVREPSPTDDNTPD